MSRKRTIKTPIASTVRTRILEHFKYRCYICNVPNNQRVYINQAKKVIRIDSNEFMELQRQGYNVYKVCLRIWRQDRENPIPTLDSSFPLCPRCFKNALDNHNLVAKDMQEIQASKPCLSIECPYNAIPHGHSVSSTIVFTH